MTTIKQTRLLTSVLTSDILYFLNNFNPNSLINKLSGKVKIKNKTQYALLNTIDFLQNLKQIIRLLQYNTRFYKKNFQIITSNNLYNRIIKYISKTYSTVNSQIHANFSFTSELKSKVVAYIGNNTTKNLQNVISKTFFNNVRSIILIDTEFNKNAFGNYKIYADINNYKKLLFLLLLMLLAQKY